MSERNDAWLDVRKDLLERLKRDPVAYLEWINIVGFEPFPGLRVVLDESVPPNTLIFKNLPMSPPSEPVP